MRNRQQMTVEDFTTPFGNKLNAKNRWVKMADVIPWDMIEDIYAASFKDDKRDGRPPIPARQAFGALYIKEIENLPQDRTMLHITENMYMQYFLGLTEYNPEPLFDSSMLTHFSKRFGKEGLATINEEIYRRTRAQEEETKDDDPPDDNGGENKGKLILDASVAPADIRYPTDLSLTNEAREYTEGLIEYIWEKTDRKGHKTLYSRKRMRKSYLKISKQRNPRWKKVREAVREQLECVEKNLETLDNHLAQIGTDSLSDKQKERLRTIRIFAEQQRWHYENPKASVPDRIVSLLQPHIRPMVRGKAGKEVEFGQKIAVAVVDGFTFIEEQSWNNFSEGKTFIDSVERYYERHGFYPEAVLADKTYRTRENINYCKEKGIRLSGPRLGRPKAAEIEAGKVQAYQDNCERNMVEGRFGLGKRRFGLDLILSRLQETSETEVAMNIICMNVAHLLRVLLCTLRQRLQKAFLFRYFTSFTKSAVFQQTLYTCLTPQCFLMGHQ